MKKSLSNSEAEKIAGYIRQYSLFAGQVTALVKSKSLLPWKDECEITISGEPLSPAERDDLYQETVRVYQDQTGALFHRDCLRYRQPTQDNIPWLLMGIGTYFLRINLDRHEENFFSRAYARKGFKRKPIFFKKRRRQDK